MVMLASDYNFSEMKIDENSTPLRVELESTSFSFRGRCLDHLNGDSPMISFTAFSFILLDFTMFQPAREEYKDYICTVIITETDAPSLNDQYFHAVT